MAEKENELLAEHRPTLTAMIGASVARALRENLPNELHSALDAAKELEVPIPPALTERVAIVVSAAPPAPPADAPPETAVKKAKRGRKKS